MHTRTSAKKRLMFIQKEDYNFLSYTLMILLSTLDCTSDKKLFKDFRKIAYLVDFINQGGNVDTYSKDQLRLIYAKAQIKKQLLHHLLHILSKKAYIGVYRNTTHKSFDLWLKTDNLPIDFLDKSLFENEMKNVILIKEQLGNKSLKTITIKDLTDLFFKNKDIITWEF